MSAELATLSRVKRGEFGVEFARALENGPPSVCTGGVSWVAGLLYFVVRVGAGSRLVYNITLNVDDVLG